MFSLRFSALQRWGPAVEVIEPARLSNLIGLIYDCAIEPGKWVTALEAMRLELGLHTGTLDLFALPAGNSLLSVTTNIPEPWASRLASYAPDAVQMWGAERMATLPVEEPAVLSRVVGMPDDSWTNPMYTEWSRPQGIDDILGIYIARDAHSFGSIGFGRHRDGPPIDDRVVELARLLIPHVQRAGAINRMLDLAALRDATFEALYDSLTAPVLIIERDARLVHVNRAGRGVLAQDRALRSRQGMLAAIEPAVHHALLAAIKDATGDVTAIGRKGLGIPFARGDGEYGALHVLPLRPNHPGGRRLAAVFVAGTGGSPLAFAPMVGALFGLTPSETAVFEHIAGGRNVSRTASALGVAPSTVRTHLQRIYDKTGVRRQAELVMLSASLVMPMLG